MIAQPLVPPFPGKLINVVVAHQRHAGARIVGGPGLYRDAMTEWAGNLAKNICTGGDISYQIGYTPTPNPCTQYTAPATTTG